jgi:hypothetical protein
MYKHKRIKKTFHTTNWTVDSRHTRRAEPLSTIFGEKGIGISTALSIGS